MKSLIKKFIPSFLLNYYHHSLAILAKLFYANPSSKLIIVGVTGTAGKSSTCYFISQILESAGFKVGITTTTLFKIADKEWLNDKKMTMLGRFQTQKLLKQMVKAKCKVAIIETSSEGIKQFRHVGIDYDILVLTNLYPEHIEAHGSFEKYKQTKARLFAHLTNLQHKKIEALNSKKLGNSLAPLAEIKKLGDCFPKIIIVNVDDEHAGYFLNFKADRKITYNIKDWNNDWKFNLLGEYNKYNVLAARAVAQELGVDKEKINKTVKQLKSLPGRLEFIPNNFGYKIIVDYSFEPKAMEKLYQTIKDIKYNKLIHVLGSTGGGRDKARRPVLGKMANQKADIVIVTNEDPYDEEPGEIINAVIQGAVGDNNQDTRYKKQKNYKLQITNYKFLYKISDRRKAIKKALELANTNDLVLITGKGAEQAMCVANGKKVSWDDRSAAKEELAKLEK